MSQELKKVSRRQFINYSMAVGATAIVVGLGSYLILPSFLPRETVT